MSPDDETEPGMSAADAENDLTPGRVLELLNSTFWVRIVGENETGSTNDDARELAVEGAPEGTVVLAAAQHAGRGRFDRTWESPVGGVYVSVILRPALAAEELSALPLAIGLGVTKGLERLGARASLKWPNDVLLDGAKAGGVLVESRPGAEGTGWAVAGVGLNVSREVAVSACAPAGAAYLADAVPGISLARCAAAVLDGIADEYARFVAGGFATVCQDYTSRSATLGAEVGVSDASGGIVAQGTAVDVDEFGRLSVRTTAGLIHVASGEVSLRSLRGGRP